MFSEGNADHPVGCDSPLQIVMAVWHTFFESEFSGSGGCDNPLLTKTDIWHVSNLNKKCAITICRGLSHLTRSLSRIVCRGQAGPKVSKSTLRPDFQPNKVLRSRIFV